MSVRYRMIDNGVSLFRIEIIMLKRIYQVAVKSVLVVGSLLAMGSSTQAAFEFTATAGGSARANSNYASFDSAPLGSGSVSDGGVTAAFSGSGAGVVNGSVAEQYAAPVFVGANNMFFGSTATGSDTTNYLSAGSGSVTLTFGGGDQNYFGLVWGSIDIYNTLSFFNADGTSVGSITGSQILSLAGSNPGVYVNIFSSDAFTRVVASSGANSFEFDNVAFANTAVPEPSSVILCGLAGLIGLGMAKARGQKAAV